MSKPRAGAQPSSESAAGQALVGKSPPSLRRAGRALAGKPAPSIPRVGPKVAERSPPPTPRTGRVRSGSLASSSNKSGTGAAANEPGEKKMVTLAGRYVIRRKLGKGSMGSVWLAFDQRLQREVAVKVLGPSWTQSEDARARFEREAMSVAQLRSQHIVQVHDYGIERERPFIVMEYIQGENLRVRLKRIKTLSIVEVANLVEQMCKGLRVAHDKGVVHRDLKPANLMFDSSTQGEELLKVLDFGVAKAPVDTASDTTKQGALLGTPQFMAPEQARGLATVDHRADLWSAAVIAYRGLTGKLPFTGETVTDTVVAVCTTKATPPSEVRPELSPLVDQFFETALSVDPDGRFQSARQLANAFCQLAGGLVSMGSSPETVADIIDDESSGDGVTRVFRAPVAQPSLNQDFSRDSHASLPFDSHPSSSWHDSLGAVGGMQYPGSPRQSTLLGLGAGGAAASSPSASGAGGTGTALGDGVDAALRPSASLGSQGAMVDELRAPPRRGRVAVVAGVLGVAALIIGLAAVRSISSDEATTPAARAESAPAHTSDSPAAEADAPIAAAAPPAEPEPDAEPDADAERGADAEPEPVSSAEIANTADASKSSPPSTAKPKAPPAAKPHPTPPPAKPSAPQGDEEELFDNRY